MIVDSGSTVNVLDSDTFDLLTKRCPVKLLKSWIRVFPYGAETPIPVKGSFTVTVSSEATNVSTHAEFVVVQSMHSDSLLVRVGPPTIYTAVNCVSPQSPVDRILSNHSKVFQGVGKLTDYQLVIHTDANVMSVAQTQGRREGRRGNCPRPPGSGGR
jgi:hypothetical protein